MKQNPSEHLKDEDILTGREQDAGPEKRADWLQSVRELAAYGIAGMMTTAVYFVMYAFFRHIAVPYMVNSCFSWTAAVMFAFMINKFLVFRSRSRRLFLREMLTFFGARVTTLLADLFLTWFCIEQIGIGEWKTKIVSQFTVMVLNYLFSKLLVFREGQKSSGSGS